MKQVAVLSILSSLFFVVGCTEPYRPTATTSPPGGQVISSTRSTPAGPVEYTPQRNPTLDRSLERRVQDALITDSTVATFGRGIGVAVTNGLVTLTGTVPGETERQAARHLVQNLPGVLGVYDQLQFVPAPTGRNESRSDGVPPATGQGAVSTSKNDIFNLHVQGLNETDRLLAQRILQGLQTEQVMTTLLPVVNIHVADGKVVLQGTVPNEEQRNTIAAAVQRAAGSGNVENQLQVGR